MVQHYELDAYKGGGGWMVKNTDLSSRVSWFDANKEKMDERAIQCPARKSAS